VRTLGVDVTEGLIYEGESGYGRGIVPTPAIFLATALGPDLDVSAIPESEDLGHARLIFREDSFDAVTRVRRGRFYGRVNTSQPHPWRVAAHPHSISDISSSFVGIVQKHLHGFSASQSRLTLVGGAQPTIVAFGTRAGFTLWRVVDIERMISGEDLVTLRARSTLGLLPELREQSVPEDALPKVREVLEMLAQAINTSAPVSVIDRARDAAQWCIGVWLAHSKEERSLRTKDLSDLANATEREKLVVVSAVARSVARLHARGKPGEQERYSARPPMEADAEFAIAAIGLVLRDIGWAQ
jgi:hypothetical protein